MSGIRFGGGIQFSTPKKNEKEPEKALDCLSRHYNIYLNDSLQTQIDFWFFTHPNKGEKGLMTILDLSASPPGRSSLKITRNTFEINDDSEASIEEDLVTIPFWLNNKVVHK